MTPRKRNAVGTSLGVAVLVATCSLFGGSAEAILNDYSATGVPQTPTVCSAPCTNGIPNNSGGYYIDPSFGTKIIRVTTNQISHVPYSTWSIFNADTSRIFTACDDTNPSCAAGQNATLWDFDKNTDSLTPHNGNVNQSLQDGTGVSLETDGMVWSGTDPNIVYAIGHGSGESDTTLLYKIDVHVTGSARFGGNTTAGSCSYSNSLGCIKNLADNDVGITWDAGSKFAADLSKSENDRVFTFRANQADTSTAKAAVVVFNTTGAPTSRVFSAPSETHWIHAVGISKGATATSGYAYVTYGDNKGTNPNPPDYEWDFANVSAPGVKVPSSDNESGHYDLAAGFFVPINGATSSIDTVTYQSTTGSGIYTPGSSILSFVSTSGVNGTFNPQQMCNGWPSGTQNYCVTPPSGATPCYANDNSVRNEDEAVILTSTYPGCSGATNSFYQFPFNDELVLTYKANPSTYSSQSFIRLAHVRSNYTDSATHYYHQPHAAIDRLARYVAFTSDMGSSSSTDVYIVKIPQAAHPTIGDYNSQSTTYGGNTYRFHLDYSGHLWKGTDNGTSVSWSLAPDPGTPLIGGLARISSSYIPHDSVWAIGQNGHLLGLYNNFNPFGWQWFDPQNSLGAPPCTPTGNPSASISNSFVGVVFACTNGDYAQLYWEGATGWQWWGPGTLPTGVTVASDLAYAQLNGSDRIYGIGSDGNLWRFYPDNHNFGRTYWSGAAALVGNPGIAASSQIENSGTSNDYNEVIVPDANGDLAYFYFQLSNGAESDWSEITQASSLPCPAAGSIAAQAIGAGFSISWAGRCKSGDEAMYAEDYLSTVYTASFSKSGYSANLPISQFSSGFRSGGYPHFYFQTSDGTQQTLDFVNTSTSSQGYVNP